MQCKETGKSEFCAFRCGRLEQCAQRGRSEPGRVQEAACGGQRFPCHVCASPAAPALGESVAEGADTGAGVWERHASETYVRTRCAQTPESGRDHHGATTAKRPVSL